MTSKENQQVLSLQVTDGLAVAIIQNQSYEFLMPTKDVAHGYGITEYTIRQHKSTNPNEFIEGKHFVKGVSISHTQPHKVFWTKVGVIRLGFFIKSERAKLFRDWAENLILQVTAPTIQLPAVPKRKHNRLTAERLLDVMADICQIENSELRNRIATKLKGGANG